MIVSMMTVEMDDESSRFDISKCSQVVALDTIIPTFESELSRFVGVLFSPYPPAARWPISDRRSGRLRATTAVALMERTSALTMVDECIVTVAFAI
jgi:hypothetical protein